MYCNTPLPFIVYYPKNTENFIGSCSTKLKSTANIHNNFTYLRIKPRQKDLHKILSSVEENDTDQ